MSAPAARSPAPPPALPPPLDRAYGQAKNWRLLRRLGFAGILLGLAAWQAEVDPWRFLSNLPQGLERGQGFLRPALAAFPEMFAPAVVTLLLAAIPTPLGIAAAIPVALAASKNLVPMPLRTLARAVITLQRGVPEIVVMVLLAAAFGLGPYPGIVAIAVGSVGMLAKLFADAIEEVDDKQMEAIACTGASRWQIIRYGILPEVFPVIVANSIFRFEINMRQAGLLGAVGAGGLGYELSASMLAVEYDRAMTVILVTLGVIFLVEKCSDWLRKNMLQGEALK